MVWNATIHVGTALTEIIVTRITGPVSKDAVLDTWGICAKHVNTRSVIQIFWGVIFQTDLQCNLSNPTCTGSLASEQSVSRITQCKTLIEKLSKRHTNQHRIKGGGRVTQVLDQTGFIELLADDILFTSILQLAVMERTDLTATNPVGIVITKESVSM